MTMTKAEKAAVDALKAMRIKMSEGFARRLAAIDAQIAEESR